MANLLEIISGDEFGTATKCGIAPPAKLFSSTDPNAPLLIAVANEEGRELARRHNWQALKVDYTVLTIADEMQTALPADYDRLVPDAELWNQTRGERYCFPTADDTWSRLKGRGVAVAAPGYARLIGGGLQITPAPVAGETLSFPYISKNWAVSDTGTQKRKFEVDTDIARLPADLMSLGIVWRWKKQRGFDYAEDMATYERALEMATSRDRGIGLGGTGVIEVGKSVDECGTATWPGTVTV